MLSPPFNPPCGIIDISTSKGGDTLRNAYLISYDPLTIKVDVVVAAAELHSGDRHLIPYNGAVIISSISSSKPEILRSLAKSGLSNLLITPIKKGELDGIINSNHWSYIERYIW